MLAVIYSLNNRFCFGIVFFAKEMYGFESLHYILSLIGDSTSTFATRHGTLINKVVIIITCFRILRKMRGFSKQLRPVMVRGLVL